MGPRTFKTVVADSEEVNRVQDNITSAFGPLLNSAVLDGTLLTNVELQSGATEIDHKLGRNLRGWIVVGQDANAAIWDSQSTNILKARTLILNASTNTTITLWVF